MPVTPHKSRISTRKGRESQSKISRNSKVWPAITPKGEKASSVWEGQNKISPKDAAKAGTRVKGTR